LLFTILEFVWKYKISFFNGVKETSQKPPILYNWVREDIVYYILQIWRRMEARNGARKDSKSVTYTDPKK